MDLTKWIDSFGLLKFNPNDRNDGMEPNGIIPTIVHSILSPKPENIDRTKSAILHHQIKPGVFSQSPTNKKDPASHDNITSKVTFSVLNNLQFHKELKIFGHFWHPRDLIFYGYCKYGVIYTPLLPILYIIMFISCGKLREWGEETIATSSKQLAWLRFQALIHKKALLSEACFKICTKLIPDFFGYNPWHGVFSFYYKNPEHPVRVYSKHI